VLLPRQAELLLRRAHGGQEEIFTTMITNNTILRTRALKRDNFAKIIATAFSKVDNELQSFEKGRKTTTFGQVRKHINQISTTSFTWNHSTHRSIFNKEQELFDIISILQDLSKNLCEIDDVFFLQ
jgi:hypothetical protein